MDENTMIPEENIVTVEEKKKWIGARIVEKTPKPVKFGVVLGVVIFITILFGKAVDVDMLGLIPGPSDDLPIDDVGGEA